MRRANKYPGAFIRFQVILAVFALPALAQAFDFGFGNSSSNSKCFLSGTIRPLNAADSKMGFQSLENRIRMNFDANDPQTCERYIKSYCQNNIIGRGDVPMKLSGYFRPAREIASEADKKPTHTYEVTENCKLIID